MSFFACLTNELNDMDLRRDIDASRCNLGPSSEESIGDVAPLLLVLLPLVVDMEKQAVLRMKSLPWTSQKLTPNDTP
jgi:hypothetical protein